MSTKNISIDTAEVAQLTGVDRADNPMAAACSRVSICARELADAMDVIRRYSLGALEAKEDLFGEMLSPEDQLEYAYKKATLQIRIIDRTVIRHQA